MCKVIAIANQKGGVGKTTTCVNLGIGLAREGKRVLLIEADAQGSMAASLGIQEPDELEVTLVTIMEKVINDENVVPNEGIIWHDEGIAFIPANIELAGLETALVNVMSREMILKQYLDTVKAQYDYILIDCMPSLGMITINALVASDYVLIPVEAAYLPVKGLQQLIKTIGRVHRKLNPQLSIMGILFTKVDRRDVYKRQDLIYHGNWEEAYYRLKKTNNFPEFTSRVRPALCEAACTCGLNGDAVSSKANEYSIIENAYEK